MQLQIADREELDDNIMGQVRRLGIRGYLDGYGRLTSTTRRIAKQGTPFTLLWFEENGKIISFCMLDKDNWYREPRAYFYTRSSHRKKGYGSKLIRYIELYFPEYRICPWNKNSSDFFRKYNLKCSKSYYWSN